MGSADILSGIDNNTQNIEVESSASYVYQEELARPLSLNSCSARPQSEFSKVLMEDIIENGSLTNDEINKIIHINGYETDFVKSLFFTNRKGIMHRSFDNCSIQVVSARFKIQETIPGTRSFMFQAKLFVKKGNAGKVNGGEVVLEAKAEIKNMRKTYSWQRMNPRISKLPTIEGNGIGYGGSTGRSTHVKGMNSEFEV